MHNTWIKGEIRRYAQRNTGHIHFIHDRDDLLYQLGKDVVNVAQIPELAKFDPHQRPENIMNIQRKTEIFEKTLKIPKRGWRDPAAELAAMMNATV